MYGVSPMSLFVGKGQLVTLSCLLIGHLPSICPLIGWLGDMTECTGVSVRAARGPGVLWNLEIITRGEQCHAALWTIEWKHQNLWHIGFLITASHIVDEDAVYLYCKQTFSVWICINIQRWQRSPPVPGLTPAWPRDNERCNVFSVSLLAREYSLLTHWAPDG